MINNETTTNSKGEVIASRKSIMNGSPLKVNRPHADIKQQQQQQSSRNCSNSSSNKENCFSENDEAASETGDSLSMISETSPDSSLIPYVDDDSIDDGDSRRQNNVQSPETNVHRFTRNNIHSDIDRLEMNNRKLSLQIGSPMTDKNSTGSSMIYNNILKNHYNQQTNAIISPVYQHNKMNLFEQSQQPQQHENLHASAGNLLKDNKQINSNCDLKNSLLNSNPTINSDSLLNIFHKNIMAVGSEPNLISMKQNNKINNCVKEEMTPTYDENGLINFPSLTDLSFNFTSLHAQKILKGGLSVNNSIDTLVELDINKSNNKSNTNLSPSSTICTDFGMV